MDTKDRGKTGTGRPAIKAGVRAHDRSNTAITVRNLRQWKAGEVRFGEEVLAELARSFEYRARMSADILGKTEKSVVQLDVLTGEISKILVDRLCAEGLDANRAATVANKITAIVKPLIASGKIAELGDAIVVALATVRALRPENSVASDKTLPRFADRDPKAHPTAEAFLKDVYKGRLGLDGDLTITELRKFDRKLVQALESEFSGKRRSKLLVLLPTPRKRSDAKLKEALGYVPEGEERRKALTVLARGERPGARTPRP